MGTRNGDAAGPETGTDHRNGALAGQFNSSCVPVLSQLRPHHHVPRDVDIRLAGKVGRRSRGSSPPATQPLIKPAVPMARSVTPAGSGTADTP